MAKWGEGDPRWIVEERPDAKNVNNWHWSEKNATSWSTQRLKELLVGAKIETPEGSCRITEMKKCEGEASANNRKAKLIFFYEWEIKCEWEGSLTGDSTKYTGNVEVPNLSDENGPDDITVNVSVKSSDDGAYKLKEIVYREGTKIIRNLLTTYVKDLKEEYSQGLILPTPSTKDVSEKEKSNAPPPSKAMSSAKSSPAEKTQPAVGVQIRWKPLSLREEFKCTVHDLYRALTVPEMVVAFTGGSGNVDFRKGGRFTLYSGNVEGQFVDFVEDEKLVMQWRMRAWPAGHFSTVTMLFTQKDDCTELQLTQTQVPEENLERTEDGWRRHYFDALKSTFGFGARLY